MTSNDVANLITAELRDYQYEPPPPGTTLGKPWSSEKVATHLDLLREALVTPYLQKFVLEDTYEQLTAREKQVVEYWVVAEAEFYCEFYDPSANDFGLAEPPVAGHIPHTVGVRGDLVGVFCAM